jgi:hypothetical protein
MAGCSDSGSGSPSAGSPRQISRTESDKTGWFGGQTHAVDTVYKNADGSTSVESEKTTTKGNNVTIVREKKTTFPDGSVKTDSETREIVKGSDNTQRETKVTN